MGYLTTKKTKKNKNPLVLFEKRGVTGEPAVWLGWQHGRRGWCSHGTLQPWLVPTVPSWDGCSPSWSPLQLQPRLVPTVPCPMLSHDGLTRHRSWRYTSARCSPGTRGCRTPRCCHPPRCRFPVQRREGQPGPRRGFSRASGAGAPGLSPERAGVVRCPLSAPSPCPCPAPRANVSGFAAAPVPEPAGRAGLGLCRAGLTAARCTEPRAAAHPRCRDTCDPPSLPGTQSTPARGSSPMHRHLHRENPLDQPTCPRRHSKTFICSGDISYHVYSS